MRKHILNQFTEEDHRRRLLNIAEAELYVKNYKKKELLLDFEPGHYIYPNNEPGDPQEDDALFQKLSSSGTKYIYTWSCWADIENRWNGKKMFVPKDPQRTAAFLELAHKHHLKVLPYTSTNFFNRNSPLFNPSWAYDEQFDLLVQDKFETLHLAHCSPSSPGWRAQLLYNYQFLLDSFDYDGVYIDSGYIRRCDYLSYRGYYEKDPVMVADEIRCFAEDAEHDGGMEDLILLIQSEVKRRGGTLSVFKEGTDCFRTTTPFWDYMLAGECASDMNYVREMIQNYKHVLLDFSPPEQIPEEEYYLNTIPFLHFPLLKQNTITLGYNAIIPDMDYALKMLALFKEMTGDGTYFYMDVDCPQLVAGKDENIICSLYVNDAFYLVLANYGQETDISINGSFAEVTYGKESPVLSNSFPLKSRELKILKKC